MNNIKYKFLTVTIMIFITIILLYLNKHSFEDIEGEVVNITSRTFKLKIPGELNTSRELIVLKNKSIKALNLGDIMLISSLKKSILNYKISGNMYIRKNGIYYDYVTHQRCEPINAKYVMASRDFLIRGKIIDIDELFTHLKIKTLESIPTAGPVDAPIKIIDARILTTWYENEKDFLESILIPNTEIIVSYAQYTDVEKNLVLGISPAEIYYKKDDKFLNLNNEPFEE